MSPLRAPSFTALLTLAGTVTAAILAALACIAFVAPADATLGIVQKIFYFHVAAAIAMMLCLAVGSALSLLDLLAPSARIDAGAQAAIETGLAFATIVLTSGPLWARKSWGAWWTWEPRLTLTLLLLLLGLSVLGIRALADEAIGRKVAAALAVLAAPIAYFIHVAVVMWGGTHPTVLAGGGIQHPGMQLAFRLSMAAVLSLAALLGTLRFRGLRLEQRLLELELELSLREVRRQSRVEVT